MVVSPFDGGHDLVAADSDLVHRADVSFMVCGSPGAAADAAGQRRLSELRPGHRRRGAMPKVQAHSSWQGRLK